MANYTDLEEAGKYLGKKLKLSVETEHVTNVIPIRIVGVSMPTIWGKSEVSILEFFERFCKNNREVWFFKLLLLNYDSRTGISIVSSKGMSKVEQNKLSLAYKELASSCMVYRIKPHTYLVNPKLITPYKNCIDAVWEDWKNITGRDP